MMNRKRKLAADAIMCVMLLVIGYLLGVMQPNLSEAEQIILAVHSANEYENGSYTCFNYSKDAYLNLTRAGIEAYFVKGDIDDNKSHAWVKVCEDYDVTGGLTKPDYSEYRYISIINITPEGKPTGTSCPWLDERSWCNWCIDHCNISALLNRKCGQLHTELKISKMELLVCQAENALLNITGG